MDSGVTKIIQTIVENWALLSTAVGGAVGGTYLLTNKFTDGQEKNLKSRIELLTEEKRILTAKLAELAAGPLETKDIDPIGSRSTMRAGVSLGQAIDTSGLVDIEWRDKAATVAPPSNFYELASTEVCIFGLSCRHSVFLESDLLKQLLRKPVDLHLVFLAPNSAGAAEAGRLLGFDLAAEIASVVNHENFKELQKFTNFYAWTLEEDIPYTGIFIDADMRFVGSGKPKDPTGQLRLQPRTKYRGQHKGLVLQFKNAPGSSAYEYFAADARKVFHSAERWAKPLG